MSYNLRAILTIIIANFEMINGGLDTMPRNDTMEFVYMELLTGIWVSDDSKSIKGEYRGKEYECRVVTDDAGKLDLEVYHQDKGKLDVWGELQIHIVGRIPYQCFKNLGGLELMDLVRKNLGGLDDCIALDPKVFADPDFIARIVNEINQCKIDMLDELCNEPCQAALPNIVANLHTLLNEDVVPEKKAIFRERLNWFKHELYPQLQILLYDDDWDKPSSNAKSLQTLWEEIILNARVLWDEANQIQRPVVTPKLPYFDPAKFMYMPVFDSMQIAEDLDQLPENVQARLHSDLKGCKFLLVSDSKSMHGLKILDGDSIQVYEDWVLLSDKQVIKIIPRIPFSQLIKLFPQKNHAIEQRLIDVFRMNMYNIADWLSLDPRIFEEPEILAAVIKRLNTKPDEYFANKLLSSLPQLALLNNAQNIKTLVSHSDVHRKAQLMLEEILKAYQYNLLPKLFEMFNQIDGWDFV